MAINGDEIGDFGVILVFFRVRSSEKSPKMGKIGDFAARRGVERGTGEVAEATGAGTDEGTMGRARREERRGRGVRGC